MSNFCKLTLIAVLFSCTATSVMALESSTRKSHETIDNWLAQQPISLNQTFSERYLVADAWGIESGANLISAAAVQGRVDIMEWLAEQGLSPTIKDSAGEEPLFHAAHMNQVDALIWLVKRGADINAKDAAGDTAMLEAVSSGSIDAAQWLKQNGASLNIQNRIGKTIVLAAAMTGNIDMLQWLKNNGVDINAKNDKGVTIAHIAAALDNLPVLQWFKNNSGNLIAKTNSGWTAEDVAAQEGHADIARWLAISSRPLYKSSIELVVREKRRLSVAADTTIVNDKNESAMVDVKYIDSLRKIDLTSCPRDFQEAFLNYILIEEKRAPEIQKLSEWGPYDTFYNLFLNEYEQLDQEVARAWQIVENIAGEYDAY